MSKGFRVEMINFEGVAEGYGEGFASGNYNNILFVAEQLLHSDDQVRHFLFRLTWYCIVLYIKHNQGIDILADGILETRISKSRE